MPEILINTNPDHSLSQEETTFRVLPWALARVENPDARRLLIETITMLASDE